MLSPVGRAGLDLVSQMLQEARLSLRGAGGSDSDSPHTLWKMKTGSWMPSGLPWMPVLVREGQSVRGWCTWEGRLPA